MYVWMAGHFGRGKDGACSVVVLEVDVLKFYNGACSLVVLEVDIFTIQLTH